MDVFDLRERVVGDYGRYVRSFLTIRDKKIDRLVRDEMDGGFLWPDPLIQLNPAFEPAEPLAELIAAGELHPECINIFRDKREDGTVGAPFRLHRHQVEGIRAARAGDSYVLTTGTGSGKSLAYIVPIVDHVLRRGSGKGIQAIIVYPMNALANSQIGELGDKDEGQREALEDFGLTVIHFHHAAEWEPILRRYPTLFGAPRTQP